MDLNEIEATIRRHPLVKDAMVWHQKKERIGGRMIAFFVRNESSAVNRSETLTEFLRATLPSYMRPNKICEIDRLPLSALGKVDVEELERYEHRLPNDVDKEVTPPRSEVEMIVSDIWQMALGVEIADSGKNFFELGGHSVLLAKVHSELVKRLNTDISLVDLFNYPTIRSLAEYLSAGEGDRGIAREAFSRAEDRRKAFLARSSK